jgi:hypothetical protein
LVDGEQLRVQRYVMGHSGLEANQRGDDGPFSFFLSHVSTVARLRRLFRVDGTAAKAGPPETPLLADSSQLGCGVEGVAAWWAAQPGWWVEFWDAGGHVDSPVRMVDESVVAAA